MTRENEAFTAMNRSSDDATKNGTTKGKDQIEEELMALNEAPTEPYDPYVHRNVEHPTTNTETLIHILKGSIGTGILAMPHAFKNSGLLVGSIGVYLIAILSTYCFLMLIRCQYEICRKIRKPIISYPDTMKYAIRQGPPFLKFLSPLSTLLVDGFIILYQLGVCCVYAVFIGDTLEQVMKSLFGMEYSSRMYIVMLLPFLIAITLIRNLKLLAPFSQVANVAMFIGIAIIMYYIFRNFSIAPTAELIGPPIRYTFFLGTTLFALMAVGVFLALENNMKNPKDFGGVTGIFSQGMAFVAVLYMLMGFIGYLRFGECVEGSITLNTSKVEVLAQCVKLVFAFAIYITYALQCYVPVDIIWTYYMKNRFNKWQNTLAVEYVLRVVCVIFTCLLAVLIPYLGLFISLIGALCLSILGIAFPALIEICLLYPNNFGKWNYILFKNIVIFVIGIAAGALGTGLAIQDIVDAISHESQNATISLNLTCSVA